MQKELKNLARRNIRMYKYQSGQLSIWEFGQPMGMELSENNRWVKKAKLIPWNEIEKRYAKLFKSGTGNVAKPLRLALGACMIQTEYGYSDVEIVLQIQENAYLQYFCGYSEYNDKRMPFDPSLMVYFRKRLTSEIIGEVNEMIITSTKRQKEDSDNNHHDNGNQGESDQGKNGSSKNNAESNISATDSTETNSGTVIVDATCAPSNIRYPQDASLLNEARENTEEIIDTLHVCGQKKPRTYRKQAHKDYLALVRCRKPSAPKVRKAIKKQLGYLKRNLANIDVVDGKETKLKRNQLERLETIHKLYEQQKTMYDSRTHRVPDRIVSLSQPWIRPIVRGKAKSPVEFGAKLDISVCDGLTRLEFCSFDAYNESKTLKDTIKKYRERTGHYPSRVLADKIYRNRENRNYCKEHGIALSGPALGRPKKDDVIDKKQNYLDECECVEVERRFSLAKAKCGLGLISAKLETTALHCISMSILILNVRKLAQLLRSIFAWIFTIRKITAVQ